MKMVIAGAIFISAGVAMLFVLKVSVEKNI